MTKAQTESNTREYCLNWTKLLICTFTICSTEGSFFNDCALDAMTSVWNIYCEGDGLEIKRSAP